MQSMQKQRFTQTHLHSGGFGGHVGQCHLGGGFRGHEQSQNGHTGQWQTISLRLDVFAVGVIGQTASHFESPDAVMGKMIAIQMIAEKITKIFIVAAWFRFLQLYLSTNLYH